MDISQFDTMYLINLSLIVDAMCLCVSSKTVFQLSKQHVAQVKIIRTLGNDC
jgi:hypothetical protein